MKLKLELCEKSDNLFVKLHPSVVCQLYSDVLASKQREVPVASSSLDENEWTIFKESPDEIQFLPLKIDFTDDGGGKKSMYCSYNGGRCEKEGYAQIPKSVQLSSGDFIDVFAINAVKSASTICVEPTSTSDWELLEIYANELEGGTLLNQVSIVFPLAQLALRLGRDTVHIKILENGFEKDPCLRLVADTEIIVTPKPRKKKHGSELQPFPPSKPIKVLPSEVDLSPEMIQLHHQFNQISPNVEKLINSPPVLSVFMHPDTLATVPGWDATSSIDLNTSSDSHPPHTAHVMLLNGEKSAVAKIISSDLIPANFVVLHPHLSYQLGTSPLYYSISIQVLTETQVETRRQALFDGMDSSSVSVSVTPFILPTAAVDTAATWSLPEHCTSNRPDHESRYCENSRISKRRIHTHEQFLEAWAQAMKYLLDDKAMLSHGTIVPLPVENGLWTLYQLQVKERIRAHDREGFPSRKISHDSNCKYLIAACDLFSISGLIFDLETMSTKTESMLNILPVSSFHSRSYLDHIILVESKVMHKSNFSANNLIIFGDQGCGKTHFCTMLSARFRVIHSWTTFYLDCRMLQSAQIRMGGILGELTKIFKRAFECQPSLLVLDNLDDLIPNTRPTSGNEDSSVHHQRGNNPMLLSQVKLLADHMNFLIQSLRRTQVRVVCTCNGDETKLHASLRSIDTFTKKMKAPTFHETERCEVLSKDLEQYGINPSTVLSTSQLAKKTDGYLPRDMKVLAARIIAHHKRNLLDQSQGDEKSKIILDLSRAIDDIISDYIPIGQQMLDLERSKSPLHWSQIGGLFQAKAALSDIILRPVKYRLIYEKAPVSLPRGIMLYGYPGCGKSCIVPALAEECGFNLVTCRGPELLDKYIGASEAKVRQLFEKAYAAAPSILFLDEFDALAPRRGSDNTGVTDRVVNQLLTFLDGVEVNGSENEMVYIIGASSRPDKIDPALLRPGRLEKHIFIGYQEDEAEWNDLLSKMSQNWNLDEETRQMILDNTFQQTLNTRGICFRDFSAADVKGVFDSAHLIAVHDIIDHHELTADENDQEISKQEVRLRRDNLMDAFLDARPSLSKGDRRIFGETYIPFLGSDGAALEAFGLDPGSFSASLNSPHPSKLKTALK